MDGATQIARGAAATFLGYAGKIARPIALALFARLYGLDALGVALLVWAYVEVVARIAGLGLDRGLQRWIPATAPDERPAVVAAALIAASVAGVIAAIVVAAIVPPLVGVGGGLATAVRLAILIMLPTLTVAVTALHAVRGARQILALVWGRSVVEPVGFLIAGLALAPFARGPMPVLAAYALSIAAIAVVAAIALHRGFGLRRVAAALAHPGALRVGALLRFSIPLGVADVVNLALQRGDVVVVGLITGAPAVASGYAVAREIVTSLSKVRQGFDQVLAPVAAELHVAARRDQLAIAARMSARWGLVLAAPLALVFVAFPEPVLALFGVASPVVATALALLALGRLIDVATGPTSILLAMVGRPRLVLVDAVVGLAVALAGAAALGPRVGAVGVAAATSAGLIVVNLLALVWLDRLEDLRPVDRTLVRPALVVASAGAALVAIRVAVGAAIGPALIGALAAWLAAYAIAVGALGLWPWRRPIHGVI